MTENSFKATLNFSSLNAYIWAKIHFNNISAKSEKMKLESGHLELRFSVHIFPIGNVERTSPTYYEKLTTYNG